MSEALAVSVTAAREPTAAQPGLFARLFRHRGFAIGFAMFAFLLAVALIGPFVVPGDPLKVAFRARFHGLDATYPFGTDHYGGSVLARVVFGARLSLMIGGAVVSITGVCGVLIGTCAGYFRRLDGILMRCMDALMAFPSLMLAIAIAASLGTGLLNLIIALGVAFTPRTARVARAAVIAVRQSEFVDSAILSGASHARVIWRHILPNSLTPLIVELTFIFAYAVLAEAALSFLGVGPPPPTPTWGNIIAEGRDYVVDAPWISIFPGIAISLTVLSLNLLGDGLRDVLDPRLKSA
jgi:peptide/nickel transport system permease protein